MKLLVDIGNTRLKWALLDDGTPGQQHALVYRPEELAEQLANEWAGLSAPQAVYIVSVGYRQVTKTLVEWLDRQWGCPVEVLQAGLRCAGVVNGYTQPECLGVDRWAAMVAAYSLVNSAVCVIDCGTALTCDAIDSQGHHLGGSIAPGAEMMRRSLLERTAGIALNDPLSSAAPWGTDTTSCVLAGGIHASIGMIERMVLQMQRQLEEPVVAVLTGGDAESLLPWLSVSYRYEANLVLQGIARMIAEQVD